MPKPNAENAPKRVLVSAILAQIGGTALTFGVLLTAPILWQAPFLAVLIQGAAAAGIATALKAQKWWLAIHMGFLPLVFIARQLDLPSGVWLCGFVLLFLIFWRTDRSQVPLYLTNTISCEAIAGLLPDTPCQVIDLGCGDGGLLLHLARLRPDCRFTGFEHAPLTWAWARLKCRDADNIDIRLGNFWAHPLKPYSFVYAFLSPVPMPKLWDKARREMAAGARLISNSFPIPGVEPEQTLGVPDRRQTRLYRYTPSVHNASIR